jgi:hypothetical protein
MDSNLIGKAIAPAVFAEIVWHALNFTPPEK